MGLASLSKKERKSGYLKQIVEKSGGHLTVDAKRRLALKAGGFSNCINCHSPKMQKRTGKGKKKGGLYCYNCGWIKRTRT